MLMAEHRHHSSLARCRRAGDVLHIEYIGPIDVKAMQALDGLVLPYRADAIACMERMDKALTMFPHAPPVSRKLWPGWVPPSAVIVRSDQQLASIEFCSALAKYGILRQTFLQHQSDLALHWMNLAVQLEQSRSRRRT